MSTTQYLSTQKASELSGYSPNTLTTWARTGRIPAQRDEYGYWYIQYPFPEGFQPRTSPYHKRKDTLTVKVIAAPPGETPAVAGLPLPTEAADQDVARALRDVVNQIGVLDATMSLVWANTTDIVSKLEEMIAQQRRLADAWEQQ